MNNAFLMNICYLYIMENKNYTIKNKKFREMLKDYPDDAIICIEYCNPTRFRYDKKFNRILID